jgi:hypothetical protein
VSKLVRAGKARRDRPYESIDRPWEPAGPEAVAPIEDVILRDLVKWEFGEWVSVAICLAVEGERRLEATLSGSSGVRPTVAAEVGKVGFESCQDGVSFSGADRRVHELREPRFGASFSVVVLEYLAESLVLLLLVSSAEAGEPGVGTSSKAQIGTLRESLPIRLVTGDESLALALAR